MKQLMRVVIAGAASIAAVAATIVPAQAYYREVDDPSGDAKISGSCKGMKPLAKLDIVRIGAISVKKGDTWMLTLTAYFAKRKYPDNFSEQTVVYNVFERGHQLGDPAFVVGANVYDSISPEGYLQAYDDDYLNRNVRVVSRGDRIVVSGMPLKAGKTYWVSTMAFSDKERSRDRTCSSSDVDNRRLTGVKAG